MRNINLESYLKSELKDNNEENDELASVIKSIADATKLIAMDTRVTGLKQIRGSLDKTNVQGEQVQILDQISNDKLVDILAKNSSCAGYASEELKDPKIFNSSARFMVVADPLDGSSNISVNMPIGTIFGIIRNTDYGKSSFIKSGRYYISAGYSLYGPSDIFVICANNKVAEFTLDPQKNDYFLSRSEIKVPNKGSIYSVNEGNFSIWDNKIKKWLLNTKNPSGTSAKNKKLRYVGSLVADAHRTLINGGIFVYPSDKNNQNGKLRLMYEANPFALIFTSAGGSAVDLEKEILDIEPENFHQRTPLIIGSKSDVNNFLEHMTTGKKKVKENTEITPIFKWTSNSITNLRKSLNLSRTNFGKKVGVSRATVLRWEKDIVLPNYINKKALDNAFLSVKNDLIDNPMED
ncbi:MAG: fructose-bisphosphatase class I [Dehalococcoidia bacterium]|nr:fructose-bisphosphatase class I [Dehalococcoidia bacterium]MEC9450994.1 helix-turn-helix domain-containing protein [Chloroflexota bacterium]MQG04575.1 helix-turn-helix domain-containing protein [SAR202 cluster bacterium]|tara:strand:+ start:4334 stop:5554 length:1221 start_codon:yes stop_codon:yes gene_type:complete